MMAEAYEGVREHLGRSAERVKQYYDFGAKPVQFEAGDQVWYYSPRQYKGRSPKWQKNFSGPWEVLRRVNTVNYAIRRSPKSSVIVVHVNKLKPYNPPGLGPDRAEPDE